MKKNLSKNIKLKKPLVVLFTIIFLGLVVFLGYRYYNHNQPRVSPNPKPTITSLPSSTTSTNTKSINPTPSHSTSISNATVNNTSSSPVSTPSSSWTQSQSGVITVKTPVANSTIKNGFQLIGSAETSEVQYRLTDNNVGVISQGTIPVVSGNFSASINFTSSGTTGRLDVFTTDNNGKEINEVQIHVII